ncbi:hypothetical protein A2961_00745 [Candidatus Woesebacteria bacterium RIFCSPLOWO2_01_FULL_39_21]|uniref:Damage-inducible protein J n=1 Tax=Candidatus Woesebacteria bacterium RIFCSPLOWO2_01_FULL_39_21 TaxID=1802519 RepID=A0A1F8BPJ5_9BACT|nr:MAG: hypothetical protein A2691_02040 [Candidatus Woesebacteria bacterium RIFCSPHIGHO2_01_FULL_39_23]OGM65208.1 MAG: hypothetical protein A2961_00745 [Candidatus Woesebacteria bacterium RIFCSPLOWO2_01_FULL_39_21]
MNTAVIITKTEPEVKKMAQQVAKEIGVSLSSLLNAYLKQLVRTRKVEFDLGEVPSEYLKSVIKRAEENYKKGKTSPAFKTGEEAVKWLEKHRV